MHVPLFPFHFYRKFLTFGVFAWFIACGDACLLTGQERVVPPVAARATLYVVPEGGDIDELKEFIKRVSSVQPESMDEYLNLQMPSVITASRRIMEMTRDQASPTYREALASLLGGQSAIAAQLSEAELQAAITKLFTLLDAATLHASLMDTAFGFGINLESRGEFVGARELYRR
ncbi:MAG: hypothetical protein AAGJ83_11945, partial [Planctomycetota bacterium]